MGEKVARPSAKSPSLGSGPSRRWVEQQAICWQNKPFSQPVVDTWRFTGHQQLPNKVMAGTFSFLFFSNTEPGRTVFGSLFLMLKLLSCANSERTAWQNVRNESRGKGCHAWAVGEIKQPTRQVLGVYCDRRESGKRTAWRKLFLDPLCTRRSTRRSAELETRPRR